MTVNLTVREISFHMRNVRTRMPFRYGVATLTSVPILHVALTAELADGRQSQGFAADILPPKWFDKDPAKDYSDNIDDLLFVAQTAAESLMADTAPASVFARWQSVYEATLAAGDSRGLNHLTSSHGSTLMERALIDAVGRVLGISYHQLLRAGDNPLGVDLGQIQTGLAGVSVADVVASSPSSSIAVRHTVGLTDPIEDEDIATDERLDDGLPQSLSAYIRTQGLTHFKIKIQGDAAQDIERLTQISSLLERSVAGQAVVSLDGNEQYTDLEAFESLLERVRQGLPTFYRSIAYIEQPLERSIALAADQADRIRRISARKPMLVDESDGDLDTFRQAIDVGYLGVSTKNCKGLFKALANAGLARQRSEKDQGYFLTAEDLMNLPVVPLQQDLAHVAALGLDHAERNGHHYVRGLDHLTVSEREASLHHHGRLYTGAPNPGQDTESFARLAIDKGRIDVTQLQVPGLGIVADAVDTASMIPLSQWEFSSL